jgi:uncharacterized protein YjbJ (UPF0337 family)
MGKEQQREGKWEQMRGTVKENVGDLTGNEKMEREGEAEQTTGAVREGIGDVREGAERVGQGIREAVENVGGDIGEDVDRWREATERRRETDAGT